LENFKPCEVHYKGERESESVSERYIRSSRDWNFTL